MSNSIKSFYANFERGEAKRPVPLLSASEIEESLLPFRAGRRLVLDKLLQRIAQGDGLVNPFLLLSRFFVRIKSADSILEKIRRKGIVITHPSEISQKLPDILGFRIITENIDEMETIDRFLNEQFEIVSRLDKVTERGEFGDRGIEYSLRHHVDGVVYPFELQLRTFLQHYWSSQSFHLFHKTPRETALSCQDALLSLSQALDHAEQVAGRIPQSPTINARSSLWNELPIRSRVHLIAVEPGEQFALHVVVPLSGNDQQDHDASVSQKLQIYAAYPGSAIVECSCLHFLSFILNEPQVRVPVDRLGKVVW
jgi:ppGpp synthetase/RelA/SpoT-type nucleotidyltranferase